MADTEGAAANAAQIDYWNDVAGDTWAALQDKLDRMIGPLGERAIEALAPQLGERIVDIGCGCGQTTQALAARVGPTGQVLGIDISRPMLAVARRRIEAQGLTQASFTEADAQTCAFEPGARDAAFSRFGVMFFEDPKAAFANIRRGLKSGGRLAFICWRPFFEQAWMATPIAAALPLLPEPPVPPPPDAPGPFGLSDAGRTRDILSTAGFSDIEVAPHDQLIGAPNLEEAVELAMRVGPLGTIIRESPSLGDKVVDAVRRSLEPHAKAEGVLMPSGTWIVTARA
jgi:SAM-dependent methyltransferase